MDVYEYIAANNPYIANQILSSFGYTRTMNSRGLANDLRVLVNKEGEPAVERIMDNHPDKEIILDLFSDKEKPMEKKSCNCSNAYLNATGPAMTQASILGGQASTFILAASLILAVAIISKN